MTVRSVTVETDENYWFVDDIKLFWRWWSLRLTAIGLAIQTLFMTWVDLPLTLWNMMPQQILDILPPRTVFVLPALFFGASGIMRIVKQRKKGKRRASTKK